jgi:hypothetical protein
LKRLVLIALCALGLAGCAAPNHDPIRYIVSVKPAPPDHVAVSLPAVGSVVEPPALAVLAAERPAATKASRGAPRTRSSVAGGDVWAALANCESHGNPAAVGGGGRYFGAFQFSLTTWHSLGYGGNPVDAPYEVQREAAQRLVARSGWGQFPVCGRRLA